MDGHSGRSPCGERGLKYFVVREVLIQAPSLPVRGAWIEILRAYLNGEFLRRRSPCGERGLKSLFSGRERRKSRSLPVRGAWIEIISIRRARTFRTRSLPVRGAWIEMSRAQDLITADKTSLPVRGAWIEMECASCGWEAAEGRSPCGERGLKYLLEQEERKAQASLPVRGAWIEMILRSVIHLTVSVAPRAGSVD